MRRAFARVGAAGRLVASRLFQLAKINGRLKELRPLSQSRLLSGPNNLPLVALSVSVANGESFCSGTRPRVRASWSSSDCSLHRSQRAIRLRIGRRKAAVNAPTTRVGLDAGNTDPGLADPKRSRSLVPCRSPVHRPTSESTSQQRPKSGARLLSAHTQRLRPRRERPHRSRTAEQRDERAPSQGWHGLSPPRAAGFTLSLARKDWLVLGADAGGGARRCARPCAINASKLLGPQLLTQRRITM